jgi:hypothetical protein
MDFLLIQLASAFVCVFFFQFRNPYKYLIHPVSFFIILVLTSTAFTYVLEGGEIISFVAGLGLWITYWMRFRNKDSKRPIDYVKLAAMIVFGFAGVITPVLVYKYIQLDQFTALTLYVMQQMGLPLLIAIYLYDRVTFKPSAMQKTFITILIGQTILCLVLLAYAFIQKKEADMQRQAAQENANMANAQAEAVMAAQRVAEHNLQMAIEREASKEAEIDSLKKVIVALNKRIR